MAAPRVSVLIVTYNHARYIRQALDSALTQKLDGGIEIVVGDDCSTDGTREIVLEYARAHPDLVTPVLPNANLGDAGRPLFVEALNHCRGTYLAMSDGDDYWTCDAKLRRQADYLDAHPECSLCYHDAAIVHDNGEPTAKRFMAPRQPEFTTTEDIIRSCCIPACSPMARSEIYSDLPSWFFAGPWADFGIYVIAAERGLLGYIDELLGVYRIHGQGAWSRLSTEARLRSAIEVLNVLDEPFGVKYGKTLAEAKSWQHVELAVELARSGQTRAALGHVGTAIRLDPTLKRTWRLLLRGPIRRFGR